MNKTITINISGIIFHIDEQAYQILCEYLDNLKRHFSRTEGGDEIINDIESRIAEIFQSKLNDKKQVILSDEVNEVINILGKPENFDDPEEEKKESKNYSFRREEFTKAKRLFRDADNKVLGGVCSGLGHYFDVDPVWLRLVFILALIFFGSGVVVYLVLWIVIPKAVTTAEKLEMKGSRVNISDIEKNIKDELEELKRRFSEFKKGAKSTTKEEFEHFKKEMHNVKNETRNFYQRDHTQSVFHNIVYAFVSVMKLIVKAFIIFLGIIILAVAIALLVGLIFSFSGSTHQIFFNHGVFSSVSFPAAADFIFNNPQQANMAIIGVFLLIGIPLLLMIYGGIKLIFGIRRRIKLVNITALVLWFSGIIICGYIAYDVSVQFSEEGVSKESINLKQPKDSTLYLEIFHKISAFDDYEDKRIFDCSFVTSGDGTVYRLASPTLKIIKSKSELFELQVIKYARGSSVNEGKVISEKINYNLNQKDSLLSLDDYFSLEKDGKWRCQDVKIILKVPVGKMIVLNNSLDNILCCSDISDELSDSGQNHRKFKMTENGIVAKP